MTTTTQKDFVYTFEPKFGKWRNVKHPGDPTADEPSFQWSDIVRLNLYYQVFKHVDGTPVMAYDKATFNVGHSYSYYNEEVELVHQLYCVSSYARWRNFSRFSEVLDVDSLRLKCPKWVGGDDLDERTVDEVLRFTYTGLLFPPSVRPQS